MGRLPNSRETYLPHNRTILELKWVNNVLNIDMYVSSQSDHTGIEI